MRSTTALRFALSATLALGILAGCGKPESKKYSGGDLSFEYPKDWRIQFDREDDDLKIHIVTLTNEDQLMVSATVFGAGGIGLEEYVEAQQETLSVDQGLQPGAFQEMTREAITLAGRPAIQIRYKIGRSAADLCRAQFVEFEAGEAKAFVYLNTLEVNFEDVEPGFEQLLESLTLRPQ
ncbi:MAG: hypothetical protein ACI8UO_001703 [Verrucomicrobiales bacterium]|jgi:hypothetical protein